MNDTRLLRAMVVVCRGMIGEKVDFCIGATVDPLDLILVPILIFLKNNHFLLWWHVYISSRFLNPAVPKRGRDAILHSLFWAQPSRFHDFLYRSNHSSDEAEFSGK